MINPILMKDQRMIKTPRNNNKGIRKASNKT